MTVVETIYQTFVPSSRKVEFDGQMLTVEGRLTVQLSEHQMDGCPALIIQDGKSDPMYYPIRDGKIKGYDPSDLAAMEAIFVEPNHGN
jgi:hypothetical protein